MTEQKRLQAPDHLARRKRTLAELWKLGRKMGLKSRSESTRIIRKMREKRYGG